MITRQYIEPEQKALEINLDLTVYGSFAEIGAGQEVARYFFQAGGAAGTIAKTMSAYDKTVSDKIYGAEEKGRYVCENRLYKMLDHEYELMVNRLSDEKPGTRFFAFADTVSALNFHKTNKGEGWMGIRYQLEAQGEANDIVLHVKMRDNDNKLQQQAVGILGVNLIYGSFYYQHDVEKFVESLMDNLEGRVHIDMLRMEGPDFKKVDNRLLALSLVRRGMTDVAMFGPDGKQQHASENFYRKSILVVRGSFHPPTLVNIDMLKTATSQFKAESDVDASKVKVLTEITLDNLRISGEIDEQDFLDRVELLCQLGQSVLVTNCEEHHKLINYLSDYRLQKLGVVVGARQLLDIVGAKYQEHKDGSLLASFGEVFSRDVKMYVYPAIQEGSEDLMTAESLPVPEGVRFLYQHLLNSGQISDLKEFNPKLLHIFSRQVLDLLRADEGNWESMVPEKVAKLIRERCLFGFPFQRMEFEY